MVPLFRYLPISCSTAYSNPPASGICLPQVSKYLGTLKLHLNSPEVCIFCTIYKYALHPDSVTRHVAKYKLPLRERATLTSVVRLLHLPDPKSLSTRLFLSPPAAYRPSRVLVYTLSTSNQGIHIALGRCRDDVRHTDISIRCWLRGQTPDRSYKAPFM
jgi:hypothetical protein